MTLPKLLALLVIVLFGAIGIAALFKTGHEVQKLPYPNTSQAPLEVELDKEIQSVVPALNPSESRHAVEESAETISMPRKDLIASSENLPDADRIEELFNKKEPRFPFIETITYRSHVNWQKGRPAWLSDYASYYNTSRHFIARSLNGKPDYVNQELKEGDKFNVFKKDRNVQFYLLVDSSRCKMWFYCLDLDNKEKILIKTYPVGLGRLDSSKTSGLLTPLGTYMLGQKIAIYKPKTMGTYQSKSTEMITVFGTRWIPFEKEIGICTAPAKGFGIHGTPWLEKEPKGALIDQGDGIGKYESDGCVRLKTSDIEELFAIIITKPTTIEIVRDFFEAKFTNSGTLN